MELQIIDTFSRKVDSMTESGNQSTAESYRNCVAALRRYNTVTLLPTLDRLTRNDVENFAKWLSETGISKSTGKFYLNIFRALYRSVMNDYDITVETEPFDIELPEFTISPKKNSISLRSAIPRRDSKPRWFALRTFSSATPVEIAERMPADVDKFMPTLDIVKRTPAGTLRHEQSPILKSLMFFRSTPSVATALRRTLYPHAMIYTHIDSEGNTVPSPIPEHELTMFRLVINASQPGTDIFSESSDSAGFAPGQCVRVTCGPFEGLEGTIRRIRRDRRVVVTIQGICTIATPHIPMEFLEPV